MLLVVMIILRRASAARISSRMRAFAEAFSVLAFLRAPWASERLLA